MYNIALKLFDKYFDLNLNNKNLCSYPIFIDLATMCLFFYKIASALKKKIVKFYFPQS